jgi:hypothetical protein
MDMARRQGALGAALLFAALSAAAPAAAHDCAWPLRAAGAELSPRDAPAVERTYMLALKDAAASSRAAAALRAHLADEVRELGALGGLLTARLSAATLARLCDDEGLSALIDFAELDQEVSIGAAARPAARPAGGVGGGRRASAGAAGRAARAAARGGAAARAVEAPGRLAAPLDEW